jgi:hypothetical protein
LVYSNYFSLYPDGLVYRLPDGVVLWKSLPLYPQPFLPWVMQPQVRLLLRLIEALEELGFWRGAVVQVTNGIPYCKPRIFQGTHESVVGAGPPTGDKMAARLEHAEGFDSPGVVPGLHGLRLQALHVRKVTDRTSARRTRKLPMTTPTTAHVASAVVRNAEPVPEIVRARDGGRAAIFA